VANFNKKITNVLTRLPKNEPLWPCASINCGYGGRWWVAYCNQCPML